MNDNCYSVNHCLLLYCAEGWNVKVCGLKAKFFLKNGAGIYELCPWTGPLEKKKIF